MVDHGRADDVISITEDDLYMYNEILHSRHKHSEMMLQHTQPPLNLSHFSLLTADSEDDADGSVCLVNDHYCSNNGSAGHSSQPNTDSSQRTSCVSGTPTPTNDDTYNNSTIL